MRDVCPAPCIHLLGLGTEQAGFGQGSPVARVASHRAGAELHTRAQAQCWPSVAMGKALPRLAGVLVKPSLLHHIPDFAPLPQAAPQH